MYWSRTGSIVDLLAWLILCSLSWVGGWLLVTHVFRLRSRERLFAGAASGLLLFILFSNILAQIIPLTIAYWASSGLILALGLLAAWRSTLRPRFPLRDLLVWPEILGFAGILFLYTLINHGLAIFDDYSNLPLVSIIATGDVPPHFYLNPAVVLDYHYGLHLFAASMVRVGGFFPWSAFDFSKALTVAFALVLIWLWYRRFFSSRLPLFVGVLLIFLGGGTRWLLLFLPESALREMGSGLHMMGSALQSGPDLFTALSSPWKMEGAGPIPFPFAFANGIASSLPGMGTNGSLGSVTLFLLLLLGRRQWRPLQGVVYGLLIASLALTTELTFVIVWAGIALAGLIRLWRLRSREPLQWGWVLVPSALLAITMGGVISSTISRWFSHASAGASQASLGLPAIAFYWPPAFLSAHLGPLSLTDPNQVVIALAEIGPLLLLAPLVTWLAWGYIRSRKLVMAGLSLMAVIGFLVPLFIRFVDRERDLSRMTSSSLDIWIILGFPYLWLAFKKSNQLGQFLIGSAIVITLISGLAMLPPQLIAIAKPQLSYFVEEPDARMSKTYWNQLAKDTQILDLNYLYRPPTLFGRSAGRASQSLYITLPEFRTLTANPDAIKIAQYGYSYVYFDKDTWQGLTADQKLTFQQPCVKVVADQKTPLGDFRRLLDVRKCQNAPETSAIHP